MKASPRAGARRVAHRCAVPGTARRPAGPAASIALAALAVLGGCAIQQLDRDIDASQGRIAGKQGELDALQRTQAALVADRDRLQADLRTRELDAAELRARLEQLRRRNAMAVATTPQQQARQADRSRQIEDAARHAQALQADQGVSPQEKAKRLEALREQTRRMLDLLLVG